MVIGNGISRVKRGQSPREKGTVTGDCPHTPACERGQSLATVPIPTMPRAGTSITTPTAPAPPPRSCSPGSTRASPSPTPISSCSERGRGGRVLSPEKYVSPLRNRASRRSSALSSVASGDFPILAVCGRSASAVRPARADSDLRARTGSPCRSSCTGRTEYRRPRQASPRIRGKALGRARRGDAIGVVWKRANGAGVQREVMSDHDGDA